MRFTWCERTSISFFALDLKSQIGVWYIRKLEEAENFLVVGNCIIKPFSFQIQVDILILALTSNRLPEIESE